MSLTSYGNKFSKLSTKLVAGPSSIHGSSYASHDHQETQLHVKSGLPSGVVCLPTIMATHMARATSEQLYALRRSKTLYAPVCNNTIWLRWGEPWSQRLNVLMTSTAMPTSWHLLRHSNSPAETPALSCGR